MGFQEILKLIAREPIELIGHGIFHNYCHNEIQLKIIVNLNFLQPQVDAQMFAYFVYYAYSVGRV